MPTLKRGLSVCVIALLGVACGGRKGELTVVDRVIAVGYASSGKVVDNSIPNQALLWVDGRATALSPGAPSYATALAVEGSEIYVVGEASGAQGNSQPMLWKNGQAEPLMSGPMGVAYARSVAVAEGRVVVGGAVSDAVHNLPAALWLNGVLKTLPFEEYGNDSVEAVALQGDQVLAAGFSMVGDTVAPQHIYMTNRATTWFGGQRNRLTSGRVGGVILGIQAFGTDIYMAGEESRWLSSFGSASFEEYRMRPLGSSDQNQKARMSANLGFSNTIPTYWKNGTPIYLGEDGVWAKATAIAVTAKGVYVAGFKQANAQFDFALYWKDGQAVPLTKGESEARTTGICVVGSDVYVSGYEVLDGVCVATIWKNGQPLRLGDGKLDSFAKGVVVQRMP